MAALTNARPTGKITIRIKKVVHENLFIISEEAIFQMLTCGILSKRVHFLPM
jgi:hypothetical protein